MSCAQSIRWCFIVCLLLCGREPASALAILGNRDSFLVSYAFVGNEKDLSLDLIQESPPQFSDDYLGFVDGPNLYAYVQQNPWTKFDPEGLSWFVDNWSEIPSFFSGVGQSAAGVVTAPIHMALHPIDTAAGLGHAATHPMDTGRAMVNSIRSEWQSGPEGRGKVVGDVMVALLTAGEGSATKAGKVAEIANGTGKVGEAVEVASSAAKTSEKAVAIVEKEVPAAKGGGAGAVQAGQAGEAVSGELTGMPKNTVRIPSASGKKAYRVPDHMDDAQRYITETKNVDYQYYSSQLKDDKAHVLRGGGAGRVDVMIDQRTTISSQLLREHLNPGSPIKLRSANLNE